MSITYTELKNAVVGQLEIDATDADRYQLDINLAAAQLGIINSLPFEYLKNVITTTKTNIQNGIHLYQWPGDFVRFVRLWLDYDNPISESSGNHGNRAQDVDDESSHVVNIAALATKRYPYVDLNVEAGYGIYPVPAADVNNGQRIRYIWQVPNPTSTQICLLEYNLRNLMVFKATELCALVDEFNVDLSAAMYKNYTDELSRFLPKKGKK